MYIFKLRFNTFIYIQTKRLADDINNKLQELRLPRYKYMVQVVLYISGQGVQMGYRCFWDSSTDNFVSEKFMNDSIFCVATAYGVYLN